MANGQLLLAVSQLRIILIHLDILRFQGGDDGVDHQGGSCHADRREAQAFVKRRVSSLGIPGGEGEFTLKGCVHAETCRSAGGNLPLEK